MSFKTKECIEQKHIRFKISNQLLGICFAYTIRSMHFLNSKCKESRYASRSKFCYVFDKNQLKIEQI